MSKSIVIIPGQGIGPDIARETRRVLEALKSPLHFIEFPEPLDQHGKLHQDLIENIRRCGVALKGPFGTPVGEGHESINVQIRRALDLYANVRPAKSFSGVPTPYHDIDIVVVRENLEGLYIGVELPPVKARETIPHPRIAPTAAVTCSVATPKECERIAEFAFQYALANGRRKVTIGHKANIAKETDGMFLRIARAVAQKYSAIEHEDLIIDNLCHMLVGRSWKNPRRFDVILLPNHWGDIVSDICAGMTGGLGIAPSGQFGTTAKYTKAPYINAQYSDDVAVFEAVHGTAPDIVGKNIANPTALLLSASMMLSHLGMREEAQRLEAAIGRVLRKGRKWHTKDLAGDALTNDFTDAIIQEL